MAVGTRVERRRFSLKTSARACAVWCNAINARSFDMCLLIIFHVLGLPCYIRIYIVAAPPRTSESPGPRASLAAGCVIPATVSSPVRLTPPFIAQPDGGALVGEVFDDEGIIRKVIGMAWSDEHQAMAVYYYGTDAADSTELAEIELMPLLTHCTHDATEFSTVKEVVKWNKDTAKQTKGAGSKRTRG